MSGISIKAKAFSNIDDPKSDLSDPKYDRHVMPEDGVDVENHDSSQQCFCIPVEYFRNPMNGNRVYVHKFVKDILN